jgi:integrase/recombinase XerD
LIEAARQLNPPGSIRPLTYATLFGLPAATGLRVSEALTLTVSDLTADGLMIRATKFKKYAVRIAMSM